MPAQSGTSKAGTTFKKRVAHQKNALTSSPLQLNWWQVRIFISAGEAYGDLYASGLWKSSKPAIREPSLFGCAGPRMQAAGVRPISGPRSLAVVGIIEVIPHIPRILLELRKLVRACAAEPPDIAILTDSRASTCPWRES